ncbi:hypothetical protein MBLNU457_6737t1 [Dothideomycetes sp. NU457]
MEAPPKFLRTASADHLALRHPTPDMASFSSETGIARNVERLEQSAEELSQGGSDIGEEIRKLKEEQRRTESRRGSVVSHDSKSSSTPGVNAQGTRSRTVSTSSWKSSIVDLNKEARWGGYSPSGYIASPSASIKSNPWSTTSALQMTSSDSMRPEPVQEGRPLDSPLASPTMMSQQHSMSRSASQRSHTGIETGEEMGKMPQTVEEETVDENNIMKEEHDKENVEPESYSHTQAGADHEQNDRPATPPARAPSADTYRQAHSLFQDFDGVHFSPGHEEFVQVDAEGNETGRVSLADAQDYFQTQEQSTPRGTRAQSYHQPPPLDGMTYYPAPVPRMLNLPKRLSQMPSSSVMAQRRSQVLSMMPQNSSRLSFLPTMDFEEDYEQGQESRSGSAEPVPGQVSADATPLEDSPSKQTGPRKRASRATLNARQSMASLGTRQSMGNLRNLPPQLRASVFFDQPSVQHNVNIQSESAVATLDSILAASVTAPVTVFTDHPFAGQLPADYYAREAVTKRHTMADPLVSSAKNNRSSMKGAAEEARTAPYRRSTTGLLTRTASGEQPKAERRNSIMSMLTDFGRSDRKTVQRNGSRMSLGSDLNGLRDGENRDSTGTAIRDPAVAGALEADVEQSEHVPLTPEKIHNNSTEDRELDHTYNDEEDDENEHPEDMGPLHVQPNTLLAELQLRKHNQRIRNRNGMGAYPNGMHSTLLELDAVAQVEKRKRQHQKVNLAWEAPARGAEEAVGRNGDESDEDVPLGVLYGTKFANSAATRLPESQRARIQSGKQLGLMERRELEDNEPLSARRNRLLGIEPSRAASYQNPTGAQSQAALLATSSQPQANNKGTEDDDDDDVPLRERVRRLKQKKALDAAIADVDSTNKRFSDEVLSQFGGLDQPTEATTTTTTDTTTNNVLPKEKSEPTSPGVQPDGEQAQAPAQRPTTLRKSSTMATLLTNNPTGPHTAERRMQKEPANGTLLAEQSIRQQIERKRLLEMNQRQSSYTARQPSYNAQQLQMQNAMQYQQQYQQAYGQQMYQPTMASPYGYNPMMHNGMAMGPAAMNGGYFAGMPNNYGGSMTPNMNMNMAYGMGYYPQGMPMNYGMGMQQEMPMQTDQRNQIDRWRSSVAK